MARLRRVAITCGAAPVRIWERSSSKVTSLTQWSRVSMPQWPCTQAASRVGGAVVGSAKVIRWTTSTVLFPNLVTVLRSGAACAAPWNSAHAGAVTTLIVRATRRPWPLVVAPRTGTSRYGRALHAPFSVGWLPLTVKT